MVPLARWFPTRRVSERILPWVTLMLATLGAVWTLFQYTNGVEIQRAETTLSIHRQFLDTFPDGAQGAGDMSEDALVGGVLMIRCEIYTLAVEDGLLPAEPALPDCGSVSMSDVSVLDAVGEDASDALRDQIREETAMIGGINPPQARRMMTFFRSLQVCVEKGQCARDITTELFVGDIVAFLNATCRLANNDTEFTRQGLMLGAFARELLPDGAIPWNTDPNRKDLYLCPYLRAPM